MPAAEQYSVCDVRLAVFGIPMIDVVCFSPGNGSVASRPSATSVASSKPDALPLGEETLIATDVNALPVVIELDACVACAEEPLDGFH